MSKYSSAAELIESSEFESLVMFAVKKYNMDLPISLEDFLQEVRIKVFKTVYANTLERFAYTTIVVLASNWAYKEVVGTKKSNKQKIEDGRLNNFDFSGIINPRSSNGFDQIDIWDELENAFKISGLNDHSINLLVDRFIMNESTAEIAKRENTSRENMRQKINNRLKLVRKHSAGCISCPHDNLEILSKNCMGLILIF